MSRPGDCALTRAFSPWSVASVGAEQGFAPRDSDSIVHGGPTLGRMSFLGTRISWVQKFGKNGWLELAIISQLEFIFLHDLLLIRITLQKHLPLRCILDEE